MCKGPAFVWGQQAGQSDGSANTPGTPGWSAAGFSFQIRLYGKRYKKELNRCQRVEHSTITSSTPLCMVLWAMLCYTVN